MSFLSVLYQVLPLAIGAAISPSITVICFALLQGSEGRRRVLAFWAGATIALAVWIVLISSFIWRFIESIGGELADATHDLEQYGHLLDLGVGAALIVVGCLRLIRPPKPTDKPGRIRESLEKLKSGPLRRQALFGAIMQGRNLTSVLLFIAAQQSVVSSDLATWQKLIVTAAVVAIATASIWLVLATPSSWTDRADGWLAPVNEWIGRHARLIELAVTFTIAAYLILRSLQGLL